jgi:hypothetical protein
MVIVIAQGNYLIVLIFKVDVESSPITSTFCRPNIF